MNARQEPNTPEQTDERVVKTTKTWIQKLEDGDPLNTYDETKADADFNFRQRKREAEERAAFEAKKAGLVVERVAPPKKKGNE